MPDHASPAPSSRARPAFTPVRPGTLQRCPGAGPGPEGECSSCGHAGPTLQRLALGGFDPAAVPPLVHEVVGSPGSPLEPATRAEMQARLGHDFSQVRVHTDQRAAESARAVNALAYTVGRHVVLGAGQYAPRTVAGRRVLAHELAHVVQQEGGGRAAASLPGTIRLAPAASAQEREASAAATGIEPGGRQAPARPVTHASTAAAVQRQPLQAPGTAGPPAAAFGVDLGIDERGRVEVTAAGPGLPVVGRPTIGIRRTPEGAYRLLVGAGGMVVTPEEVPEQLRKAVQAASRPAGAPLRQVFQAPTCRELRAAEAARFMTYDEYRLSRMLVGDALPMTPALYQARLAACGPVTPAPAPTTSIPATPTEAART
jgi:hypothetical protein